MELVAITLARITALVQLHAWDPFGKTSTLEAIRALGDKYSFAKVPRTFAELDPQKGIELAEGRLDDIVVDKITVYVNGLMVDTRSSTDNSEKVLNSLLELVHQAFGATIRPVRRTFTSQLVFKSDLRLASLNPALEKIAERVTTNASADMKHAFRFEPTAILINTDLSQTKIAPSVFSVERLAETPFTENTYFSVAPMKTSDHLDLVREFESALLAPGPD